MPFNISIFPPPSFSQDESVCSHHYSVDLFIAVNRAASASSSGGPRCYGSRGTEVANLERMADGRSASRGALEPDVVQVRGRGEIRHAKHYRFCLTQKLFKDPR